MTTHSRHSSRWNTRAPWLSKLMLLNWLSPRYPPYPKHFEYYHVAHLAKLFEASKAAKPAHVSRPSIHTKFTRPFNQLETQTATITTTTKPSLTPLINRCPCSLNASDWEEWRVKGFACFVMNLFLKQGSSGKFYSLYV